MAAASVAMDIEVTSSDVTRDRVAKRHAYAGAKIPLYLLVDRKVSRVTLFSNPAGDDYSSTAIESFGGGLKLPEPFYSPLKQQIFSTKDG